MESGLSTFIESIKTSLTDFSTTSLSTVIVAGLAIAIPLVIAWFAYRFIKGKAIKGLTKGGM